MLNRLRSLLSVAISDLVRKARGVTTPEDWFHTCSRCGRTGRCHSGAGDLVNCVRFDPEPLPVFWTLHETWGDDETVRTPEGHLVLVKAPTYSLAANVATHYLKTPRLVQPVDLESLIRSLMRDPRAVIITVS